MKKSVAILMLIGCMGLAHAQVGNTQYGNQALQSNTTGTENSAFGSSALMFNTVGSRNTAVGESALAFSRNGDQNTAIGWDALQSNLSGAYNTADGAFGLGSNGSGMFNTSIGAFALEGNTSGAHNIGVGYQAGYLPQTGNYNIEIGNIGLEKDNDVIRIGTQGVQKFTQIAGIYDSKVIGGRAVVVDSKGHLGYAVTKVVPNVESAAGAPLSNPASVEDVVNLRTEMASLRTELNRVKAEVASLRKAR